MAQVGDGVVLVNGLGVSFGGAQTWLSGWVGTGRRVLVLLNREMAAVGLSGGRESDRRKNQIYEWEKSRKISKKRK